MHEFTHNQSAQSSDTTLEAPFGMWGRRINIQQWVAVAHAEDSLLITLKRDKYRELSSGKLIECTSSKYLIFDVLSVLPRL